MKNLQSWQSYNENYPAGAAQDSRAPWNQKSPNEQYDKFNDIFVDNDGNQVPVKISYTYYELDNDINKYITSYHYDFPEQQPNVDSEYIDEMIQDLIAEYIGKYHEFVN